jgi:hypothetical protein
MTKQEVTVSSADEFKDRIHYETLYDGDSHFSYIVRTLADRSVEHLVYQDVARKRGTYGLLECPLDTIQGLIGGDAFISFADYFDQMLPKEGYKVGSVTKSGEGKVVVEATTPNGNQLRFTVDQALGNMFTKSEAFLPGSKAPNEFFECDYEALGDCFVPSRYTYYSDEGNARVEMNLSYTDYTTLTVSDANVFTMAALQLPGGTRVVVSRPGVPVEAYDIGGISGEFLDSVAALARKVTDDNSVEPILRGAGAIPQDDGVKRRDNRTTAALAVADGREADDRVAATSFGKVRTAAPPTSYILVLLLVVIGIVAVVRSRKGCH